MDEKYRYLNLQEQVGKNKHDIEELRTVKFNLERAGVRVVGEEASASDLPDPVTYTGQLGDAYLIGTEAPYNMYIYTQPSVGETNFKWFNIGAFPALGPQGEQGPQGPRGPQGDASNWRFGTVNPAILDTDREHDGYLNTTTGMVFEFSGTNWIPIGSIQGPRGNQGPIGPQGPTGRTGAQGNPGPQGPAGITIEIIGVVDTIGSLPDPSTVSRNAGYILESGDDKNLYIIVEDENQDLTWYDAGYFGGVPGTPAGFGTISATVTPITPGTAPSVTVATSGTNEAKNIAFAFSLPVGAELENTAASTPSETKGYTQKVIDQKTMDFVIKKPSDLGFTDGELPVSILDVMQKITAQYTDMDIVIINESANENIKDAPSTIGQLFIRTGKGGLSPLSMWVDSVYNVHLFYGTDGNTPANPVWYRIITTKDAAGIGTPEGGTTGQLLAKRSDEDFDTVWEDVPNAPNGIPAGGSTGKILVKKSNNDYDTEWQTKPTGIPNGGTTGQIIKKQSGNDGDVAWSNPPVGLPAGGTSGQVLAKSSGTDYAVEWATPAGGGGGGGYMPNLLINPDFKINQRGYTAQSINVNAQYTVDRWMVNALNAPTVLTPLSGGGVTVANNHGSYTSSISQPIEKPKEVYGKKITLSARVNGTILSITGTAPQTDTLSNIASMDDFSEHVKLRLTNDSGAIIYATIVIEAQNTVTIDWVKLEIGEEATPFSPPDPATELEKCEYYFEYKRIRNTAGYFTALSGSNGIFTGATVYYYYYYKKKRVAPTMTASSTGSANYFYNTDGSVNTNTNKTLSVDDLNKRVYVKFQWSNVTNGIVVGAIGITASFYLDAEIY